MARAVDVAQYILNTAGEMTVMKLQKLVYYSQAWSLVWDERPMFSECIEAWRNGPVCVALYQAHRGQFKVSRIDGADPTSLDQDARETVEGVITYYGGHDAQYLSDLTHMEVPWQQAREGIEDHENCNNEITHAMMHEYYSGLNN